MVGEVLKLLLLKEKEQMVLDVEEAAAAMPGLALAPRTGCDAKRDGMRGGQGGAAQAGAQPCPFPPGCAGSEGSAGSAQHSLL